MNVMDFPGPGATMGCELPVVLGTNPKTSQQGQPGFLKAKPALQALIDVFCQSSEEQESLPACPLRLSLPTIKLANQILENKQTNKTCNPGLFSSQTDPRKSLSI